MPWHGRSVPARAWRLKSRQQGAKSACADCRAAPGADGSDSHRYPRRSHPSPAERGRGRGRGLSDAAPAPAVRTEPAQAIVTRRAETRRQYRGAPFAQARLYRAYARLATEVAATGGEVRLRGLQGRPRCRRQRFAPVPAAESPLPCGAGEGPGEGALRCGTSAGGPHRTRASDRDPKGGDPQAVSRGSVRAGTVVSCLRE
jgi:hypothetical protein